VQKLLIGIVDTGINPWHSHVRGEVLGCRIYLNNNKKICEDNEFSDPVGHGTAVAGVLRKALPEAGFFAVKVFENGLSTYPSLVAAGHPEHPDLLPASLPGVYGVICDDELEDDEIVMQGASPYPCRARGIPRKLDNIPPRANLRGHSLACARVTACIAQTLNEVSADYPERD